MTDELASLRADTARVLAALPAKEIGEVYCEAGGIEFFEATSPRIVEHGSSAAAGLVRRLSRVPTPSTSLYVGAGIAELPLILAEVLWLERSVVVCNLREVECELLAAALRQTLAIPADRLAFHAVEAERYVEGHEASISHLAMISVLTDPETYPTVSGLTYGRLAPVLLDTEAFDREREVLRELLDAVGQALSRPGLVTTTGEEGPWVLDWAARVGGVAVEVDDESFEAPVVGDPIGFMHVAVQQ